MSKARGVRRRQLERIALVIVPSAQINTVALLAALRHPHDVGEELAAFLELRGEKFDVAEMSNVVDRFGCHGCRSFVSFYQFCRTARANASTRLLAGIGTTSASASPALSP